jgi:replicative DNA helicase
MNARTLAPFDEPNFRDFETAKLRVPPHSTEAETSVLGGLMLDNGAWDTVGGQLTEQDFYRSEHKVIFAAISALVNTNKAADVLTVFEYLQSRGKADQVGGLAYLNSLAQYVPSAANIRRYAEIICDRSILRKLAGAGDAIATSAFDTQGKDAATLADEAGALVSGLVMASAPDEWISTDAAIVTLIDAIQARADGRVDALPTGLTELDELLDGGLRGGQLVIIGARPSMGKSAMAVSIGMNVAQRGKAVGMFSLEMPAEELASRQLAMVSHVHLSKIRRSERLNDHDWPRITAGLESLRAINFHISEQSGININQLRARARKQRRQHGLDLLIVDYLGLMGQTNPKDNRNTALGEATRGMKNLAKELNIPIICLAQLGREVEKRTGARPILSDLRDSGEIEQDADIVIFIDRPALRDPNLGEEWKLYAEAIVAKQRNGSLGAVTLRYVGEHVTFLDWGDGQKPRKQKTGGGL